MVAKNSNTGKRFQRQYAAKEAVTMNDDRRSSNYPVEVPTAMNADELAYMSDQDLSSRCYALASDRMKVVNSRMNPRPWEVELAYVQREMMMRNERHALHMKFLDREMRIDDDARWREQCLTDEADPVNFDNVIVINAFVNGGSRANVQKRSPSRSAN